MKFRALVLSTFFALAGCDSGDNPAPADPGAAADFALLDDNPTSDSYRDPVSPRDYTGMVSAWYFGHST
ncbi:MAG: hypothetical protein ACYTGN_15645 [Planctomycetota bacterium]|jgi:hypothetical protein